MKITSARAANNEEVRAARQSVKRSQIMKIKRPMNRDLALVQRETIEKLKKDSHRRTALPITRVPTDK